MERCRQAADAGTDRRAADAESQTAGGFTTTTLTLSRLFPQDSSVTRLQNASTVLTRNVRSFRGGVMVGSTAVMARMRKTVVSTDVVMWGL